MDKFIEKVKFFIYTLDITEIAFIKIAAVSFGILLGINMPPKSKKVAGAAASFAMIAFSIPLISRFYKDVISKNKETIYEMDDDCFEII